MNNLRAFHRTYWEQAKEQHKPELLVFVGHGLIAQENAPAHAVGLGTGHRFFGGQRDWEKIPRLCAYLRDFLAPGATIVLESCATGADDALAQELSKNLPGMMVIAPKYTTQSIAIGVEERPGGAMVVKPEGYGGLNGDGTVRIFRDGVVVEEKKE
ncbi:hypothetical protein HYT95_02805 [Candidatus Peregrinibacteria bacterium]|nr:hypothetical protein [Candidatus Peregrinibacteria bacterium]